MPGTLQELIDYFESEGNKKESKKFKTGHIRTFIRQYYRNHRGDIEKVTDHYIPIHDIFMEYNIGKESYFSSVARKAYPNVMRDEIYYIDLTRQRITKTRKSE